MQGLFTRFSSDSYISGICYHRLRPLKALREVPQKRGPNRSQTVKCGSFRRLGVPYFGGPYNKDPKIIKGTIFGSPIFGNPHIAKMIPAASSTSSIRTIIWICHEEDVNKPLFAVPFPKP